MSFRWILIAVIVVLGIGVYVASRGGAPIDVALAVKGEIRAFVDERAKSRLPEVYRITTPQAGRVLAITLEAGAPVRKGQVVAKMDPADLATTVARNQSKVASTIARIAVIDDSALETSALEEIGKFLESMARVVEAASAETTSSKARSDLADLELKRGEELVKKKSMSVEEFNRLQVDQIDRKVDYDKDVLHLRSLEAMQAAMQIWPREISEWRNLKKLQRKVYVAEQEEAEEAFGQAKRDESRGNIASPIDGVVLRRLVSNERVLPAGDLLLELGRLEELEVEADVLSQDVVTVKVGDAVDVYGPALGAKPLFGKVARIYPQGFTKVSSLGVEQQRVTVIVQFNDGELARLKEAGRALGNEFQLRVRIYTASKSDVVKVPRNALFRGQAGSWQLFVVRDGLAQLAGVEVGIMNDDEAEIVKGITVGEAVILAPDSSLTTGMKVAPRVLEANPP